MSKIVDELHVEGYAVLKLDGIPNGNYKKYRIDGIEFEPVSIYDAENCIAIQSNDTFVGKVVEFI